MLNYFDLLSSILDNNPNRLLISPYENKIVASFGESRSIKLESFDTYSNFKQEVLKVLSIEKIGFGSLFFDISNSLPLIAFSFFGFRLIRLPSLDLKYSSLENILSTNLWLNTWVLSKLIKGVSLCMLRGISSYLIKLFPLGILFQIIFCLTRAVPSL